MRCDRTGILTRNIILSVATAMIATVWIDRTKRGEAAEPVVSKHVVGAWVDGKPIHEADVRRKIEPSVDLAEIQGDDLDRLLAMTLERLVEQRLVQHYLDRKKISASDGEVELKFKQLVSELNDRKKTLQNYLTLQGLSEAELKREMRWQMSWRRHVEKQITDDVLKKYFTKHAQDYDGRRLKVSQILLRPKQNNNSSKIKPNDIKPLVQETETLRAQIVGGKVSFGEAAKRYSAAPSKDQEGDQGWITRRGEYGEAFSRAAFALEAGEVSEPVVTRFGVHLIQCTKIQPGKKKWTDVTEQLQRATTTELFQRHAQAERSQVEVKYTGAVPYLESGKEPVIVRWPKTSGLQTGQFLRRLCRGVDGFVFVW